ncbi:hypothetical protein Bbelb_185810 [Branchiostoma belcheri]|nr:hypothetical protein Bbelb_185810 [Branchiostoma belcheri]
MERLVVNLFLQTTTYLDRTELDFSHIDINVDATIDGLKKLKETPGPNFRGLDAFLEKNATVANIQYTAADIDQFMKNRKLSGVQQTYNNCVMATHRTPGLLAKLREANIRPVFVPARCTGENDDFTGQGDYGAGKKKLLSGLTRKLHDKKDLTQSFTNFYAEKVTKALENGTYIENVKVDLRLSAIKPLHANWLLGAMDRLAAKTDVIGRGWERTGIRDAIQKRRNSHNPEQRRPEHWGRKEDRTDIDHKGVLRRLVREEVDLEFCCMRGPAPSVSADGLEEPPGTALCSGVKDSIVYFMDCTMKEDVLKVTQNRDGPFQQYELLRIQSWKKQCQRAIKEWGEEKFARQRDCNWKISPGQGPYHREEETRTLWQGYCSFIGSCANFLQFLSRSRLPEPCPQLLGLTDAGVGVSNFERTEVDFSHIDTNVDATIDGLKKLKEVPGPNFRGLDAFLVKKY